MAINMNQVEGIPEDSWQTALKIPPNSHVGITVHTSACVQSFTT